MFTLRSAEYDSYLVENWDTETLIIHLKEQNLKLDDDDFKILHNEKITGQTFLGLTKKELQGIGLKLDPVEVLLDEIKALKEKPILLVQKVLAKYSIDSNGTDTIPLFSLQTHKIQDSDKHLKYCIAAILVRLKNYGSLVVNSLKAIHNEYVMTILHITINITRDSTGEELSMKPEYDEYMGWVNFTIKKAENLICVTKDKPERYLEDDDDNDYLYGIVTTARDWHFLLYTLGKILQDSKLPFSIKFFEDTLNKESEEYKSLCNSVKKVLDVVVGLLKNRAYAEDDSSSKKKAKIEEYHSKNKHV
ncbi:hypothetical protein C1645_823147 [Glomus cerebriforme]|uniref:SAM domain-containing protein n=1 Tax=Glomus cerebriforme TaxID=658196 RepID=A0A397T6G3_9GLOM|nr:hypothetical protein C1645_823147 [Glomus cerebriforme]